MEEKLYLCRHCGNIIYLLRDNGVALHCCGTPMVPIFPDTAEASGEKHRPIFHRDGNTVHVQVGATAHPMSEEHYIQWICLETQGRIQFVHLSAQDPPCATFSLCDGEKVQAVYAFCNQHELWRN